MARKWLGRPVFKLTLAPGERSAADLALAGSDVAAVEVAEGRDATGRGAGRRQPEPAHPARVGQVTALQFPAIERTTLKNGMKVVFARRTTLPVVRVAVGFDAGNAADDRAKLGTHALMTSLLDEGTTTRDVDADRDRGGAAGRQHRGVGRHGFDHGVAVGAEAQPERVARPVRRHRAQSRRSRRPRSSGCARRWSRGSRPR